MKKVFVGFYILTHLFVALMGLRIWPLTDYPMFGWSYPKREKIHSYYWAYQSKLGDQTRILTSGYGLGDLRTFIHAFNGKTEKLSLIADGYIKNAPPQAHSLVLVDRFVQRLPDESFEIKEEIIFKKSVR